MNRQNEGMTYPCGREILSISFPGLRESTGGAVGAVVRAVAGAGLSTVIDRQKLHLVIDEAVTNAMEHGNGWDPAKKVTVVVSHAAGRLRIAIGDEGGGFRPDACTPATGTLKNRGRGLSLMRHFCETAWNDKGNVVILYFALIEKPMASCAVRTP
ncbi:MAG TPA: ATP-binding protein [Spirochaetota bacterium]|nr:ATP-binding protein [Spirochaetota bacterium]